MATPSLAKGLDQELTCPICLELFKEPTILPCLHSFCKGCLKDVLMSQAGGRKADGTIHCPKCRTQHPLPSGGVEGFPTHFTLTNLVELLNIHGQEDSSITSTAPIHKCENDLDDNPATSKCFDCNYYLCESCTVLHKKQRSSKHHKVVSLADIKKMITQHHEQKRYCSEHEEEELKLFCRTCSDVICRDCTVIAHKSHDYTFIKSAKDELVKQMESILVEVEAKEVEFANHREHLERVEQESTENIKQCKARVVQFFADWYQRMKAKEEDLLHQLDSFCNKASKKLAAERDTVELMAGKVESAIKFTKQLIANGTPSDIAMMSTSTCKQLDEVKTLKWDPKGVTPYKYNFVTHESNPTTASVEEEMVNNEDLENEGSKMGMILLQNYYETPDGVNEEEEEEGNGEVEGDGEHEAVGGERWSTYQSASYMINATKKSLKRMLHSHASRTRKRHGRWY